MIIASNVFFLARGRGINFLRCVLTMQSGSRHFWIYTTYNHQYVEEHLVLLHRTDGFRWLLCCYICAGLWENHRTMSVLPNPFLATGLFLYSLKTSENVCFFMFLGSIERDQLHEKGWKCFQYKLLHITFCIKWHI